MSQLEMKSVAASPMKSWRAFWTWSHHGSSTAMCSGSYYWLTTLITSSRTPTLGNPGGLMCHPASLSYHVQHRPQKTKLQTSTHHLLKLEDRVTDTVSRIQFLCHFAHLKIKDKWRPALKTPWANKASLLIETKVNLTYFARLLIGFRADLPEICHFGILIISN